MDVTFLAVSAERFCINQLAMTSLLLMQHVVLAFQNPTPAPYAEIRALVPALKAVFGKRCWLLPAQCLAPHSGCSREPLHLPVPQPVLPSVLLCAWFQACEALLNASQALQKPRCCCWDDVSGKAGMKQLSGTSKTFMPQGSGQQLLEFSTLVQNLQLFQELPLPGGSSFLPYSLVARLSCAAGKPAPCSAPAGSGLPALMQNHGCQGSPAGT